MPTRIDSHSQNSLIINGHRFRNLADEDPPVEFPTNPVHDTTTGKNGEHYIEDTNERGGPVKVKLFPNTPDVDVVLGWREQALSHALDIGFSGSYYRASSRKTTQMSGGVFISCPASSVPGQTFEVTFDFERLVNA